MLSRKIIILKSLKKCTLPYDYYYEASKNIYQKISLYNKEYGKMLHDEGFRSKDKERKKLKLFNFSLMFEDKEMTSKGILLNENDTIKLVISGYNKVLNAFLQGLIQNNKFNICNILFEVENVLNNEKVRFNKINIYKTISPVVESVWDKKIEYLNPYQPEYYNAIKQNLKRKYELIYDKPYEGELKIMIEDMLKVKEKTISIKNAFIKGYGKYEILVQADKEMQKVAYYCGLGQNNSIGAGYLQYITGGE